RVVHELEKRLRADLDKNHGDFRRIHALPRSTQDVPDDLDARLVVLGSDQPYSKEANSPAESAARAIFESRGNSPRLYRNTLVFLALDKTRWQDLDDALRRYLAWESIVAEKDTLDLSPHQVKQAETQKAAAHSTVTARIPEAYQWLLVPIQTDPQAAVQWQAMRLTGQDPLAVRVSKKLRTDELLVTGLGPTRLRMEMDRVPLWRGEHVAIKQLMDDFARYLYLPRLADSSVLLNAIADGLSLLTWELDSFGYADSYDESVRRYRGLRGGYHHPVSIEQKTAGLLVKSESTIRQWDREAASRPAGETSTNDGAGGGTGRSADADPDSKRSQEDSLAQPAKKLTRFHGSVALDPTRAGRDASRIAEEVIAHIQGLVGSRITVTLEISAEIPDGAPDHVVRIVTENSRTLKFSTQGFEEE
nr:ATP-binding protein [Methylotetracoccus sp.]